MYKEVLRNLSWKHLYENACRLQLAVEELQDCLENVLEEQDELLSTNFMLKAACSSLQATKNTGS